MRIKKARCIAAAGWLTCLFLSLLPLSKTSAFGDAYFGRTGLIALSFTVSREFQHDKHCHSCISAAGSTSKPSCFPSRQCSCNRSSCCSHRVPDAQINHRLENLEAVVRHLVFVAIAVVAVIAPTVLAKQRNRREQIVSLGLPQ